MAYRDYSGTRGPVPVATPGMPQLMDWRDARGLRRVLDRILARWEEPFWSVFPGYHRDR